MQNHCAVPNCTSAKSDPQPLFRFPHDPERSKKWVEKCQRKDLIDKSPDQLHRYYRLCGKHFETSLIDCDAQSTVLKDDAIPTIFDMPSQPQNGQVKRSKETTKDDEAESRGRKKIKKSQADKAKEDVKTVPEEDEYREYLKSLFEVLVLLGEQSIPPAGPSDRKLDGLGSSNFQALLEYRMNCGDEVLKKRYDVNKECCSPAQLSQLIEVCEKCIRSKLVEEVKQNGFFSLLTDDLVKISGEWHLPVFVRFVDQSNCQQERFFGFLRFEGDGDALAETLLSEMTDKWGLGMEQCRGQAHSCSGIHFDKIKTFSAKLMERYPMAVLTLRSTRTLNVSLANGMALSGVQLVMSTFKKIESFFSQSHLLQLELEHAILIFYPDKEEKANELKDICRTSWTSRHDAFEVAVDILEALLLCVDSVHDNEDMRWNDQVTHDALEISKALADFEFVMALVVLKNAMTLTRAFGKNVQGKAPDVHFAATSLKAVLHSLKEVSDNIDVYHEFWNDEAVNLATAMEIPVKVPRSFLRKHQSESGTIRPESYYKDHLSVPVVNHIIKEINELFCENHLKSLRCLSLVPAVIEQHKSTEPEEESIQVYKNDIPNAGTLSAELHCWWVKWSKKGKGETFPSNLHETLQLADVKFFPNMLAVLRLIGILPTLALEDSCNVAYKRFKMYMENTPDKFKSKSLALLNMNYDVGYDLDSMVEVYMNTYPEREEVM
ncbi:52 kDa repressor of the inhibitor of the protein kinase-like isoform X1 [Lates japonicus]|uniref:52 kDa repressor of the inhibitor of the protein kinase-like isoform X1 n=1 Tax=Lates japonicus TaxID=270547 RepID=A0AAD3M3X5_LATJO|nr:52 kDa repressor of the inhibitor of the protein kinase-like isoform X1 [Lates japonicus]